MGRFEERIDAGTKAPYWAVFDRGEGLLENPLLNKGTCFSAEEREAFGLRGLLPPGIATEEEQRSRAYENYQRAGDEVQRYLFLAALQDRNETLFYRLFVDHLEEMAPIVYTPTVGKVCEQFSHIYRRPRGLYISSQDRGRIRSVLENAGAEDTDNEILLADPLYLGVPHRRLRGEAYDSLVDELVAAIREVFPNALVQWEDFASRNAFRVLARHRHHLLSFNDDIEGTGAVVVAGIRSALRHVGRGLADERIVFFGAGASGAGCALAARAALGAADVPEGDRSERVLCLDSRGLILGDRPGIEGEKAMIAADPALVRGWSVTSSGAISLADVVKNHRPTILIGASGQPGTFTESILRAMRRGCPRPIVLPISNPTAKAEATPADILDEQTAITGRPGEPIYPPLARLRDVSFRVAVAVGQALVAEGAVAPRHPADVEERVRAMVWDPVYRPYRPA